MGDHLVVIEFDVLVPVELKLGDYVTVNSQRFCIRYNESVKKTEKGRGFNYVVTLHAEMYGLQDTLFFLFGQPERVKNHDFYNGTVAQWADIVIENMNRNDSGWSLGSVIESEAINMSFRDKTCAEVLNDLVSEVDTEYWITGKTINIGRREYSSNGLSLSQGDGGGLRDLELSAVDDVPPVTVVFPYGSDKNLTKEYGNDYLVLPNGQLSMQKNVDKYGRIEKSMQFEHIFPKGEFHVSAKIDDFTLQSSDIDFNLTDCLIEGVEVIVTFQGTSGLAGYDLAIVEGSWNNTTKQFKLKQNEQENALKVPGDIHFAVGDMFILTGLKMPQSYITAAELKLQEAAQEFLDDNSEKRVQLQCKCDDIYFKKNNITVACGQMVGVVDNRLDIDREIRCTAVRRYVENSGAQTRYEITLSDFLSGSGLNGVVSAVKGVPQEIERNVKPVREYTKRSYADVKETLAMMFDPEGDYFTEVIRPLAIETAQLIVGTNSQQFDLVGVRFIPNYNDNPNGFYSTAGRLVHFTIDPDGERTWNIGESNIGNLNNSLPYYVYAKCERDGDDGVIFVTEQQIRLLDDPDYYHFWIGVLNTPENGVRSWQPMHGFTEIAGQQITTGIIKDKLARLVINLIEGTIYGKVTFAAGSSGLENVEEWQQFTEVQNYVDNVLSNILDRLQAQIDDQIESWFYHYDPTMSNIPASDWVTDADKEKHLDDTFTNLDSGQSWRFTKDGSVYGWTLMADTAASQALVLAGKAKDTADGKRRVFVNTPYPPYDIGDLWVQGASGDIMRCSYSRQTGSYVASDWVKASKYTDDSAALAAIDTAVSNLNAYLDGAFSDGIISEAEAVSIELYLNILATEKANIDSGYTALYGNSSLTGTAKINLSSAKTALDTAYSNLVSEINSAISDGKVTASEKSAVNTRYSIYGTRSSAYSARYGEAHASISSSGLAAAETAAKEDMAKRLGYSGYSELVAAAVAGETIMSGGMIQTALIDAAAIVTSELIAQRLTAAMIEALDIVTSKLTVTSGAKIGNFTIEGGWLKSTAAADQDVGYIDMRNGNNRIAFGSDLIPSTAGGGATLTGIIRNGKMAGYEGETCALELEAVGDINNKVRSIALIAKGGILARGCTSFVEELPGLNVAIANSSGLAYAEFRYFRCFMYQTSSPGGIVYLPSGSSIGSMFGHYFTSGRAIDSGSFITIKILVTRFSEGVVRIQSPASNTPLVDHSGNVISYIEISKGAFIELTYFNYAWYLTSKNWS
jgi:hypothetical protein